mmetsp:Transcript_43772/g.101109  ORF Transcript_43772/g.101109 Transcript_43772/m.101109 type:complete len:317 (+) Transcript_43772:87-1037(+)
MPESEQNDADNDSESCGAVQTAPLTGASWQSLSRLPPLPDARNEKNMQAVMGFTGTFCIILLTVTVTCGAAYVLKIQGRYYLAKSYVVLVLVEALVALICWFGLLVVDPGSIPRTPSTALPIPAAVVNAVEQDDVDFPHENLQEGHRTYCVRCFLWRDDHANERSKRPVERCFTCMDRHKGGSHHCSVCQRCVLYFDHHCSWFGRCIAGRGMGGNIGFFKVILAMGHMGMLTCASSTCLALSRTKWGFVLLIGVVIYCAVAYGFFVVLVIARLLHISGTCTLCRRCCWRGRNMQKDSSSEVVQGVVIGIIEPGAEA